MSNQLGEIVKQAQRMQQQIGKIQSRVGEQEFEGSAGGGAVVATVNGKQEVVDLVIKPEVVDPQDVEMLAELILTAINLAMKNAQDTIQSEVNKVTGGLNIPGLF